MLIISKIILTIIVVIFITISDVIYSTVLGFSIFVYSTDQ